MQQSAASLDKTLESLGEEGDFRIKGEGYWKGIMHTFDFQDLATGDFVMAPPYGSDLPKPYTVDFHGCGLDTYKVATTYADGLTEEVVLGRGTAEMSAVSTSNYDQDEDGSYSLEHCMLSIGGLTIPTVAEHCIYITSKERVRLLIGYDLKGKLRTVRLLEETRDESEGKLTPAVVVAMKDDMMQGIGAADELDVEEEKMLRTSMSVLSLGVHGTRKVWKGRGRVRLHAKAPLGSAAALSTPCTVEIGYEYGGGEYIGKTMTMVLEAVNSGKGGNRKSRRSSQEEEKQGPAIPRKVQEIKTIGTVDVDNYDAIWFDDKERLMMILPGGCYAVYPRSLGTSPGEGTAERKRTPTMTEFGVFFRSAPGGRGYIEGAEHMARSVRLYNSEGLLSSCINSLHTLMPVEDSVDRMEE